MMRARDAWAAMHGLPLRDFAAAFGDGSLLILAPHPDDESLGCGGLIAEACARGRPPLVAILTDGSKSHPGSAAVSADQLRALREGEAKAAVAELGLPANRLIFLRYPDTQAPASGPSLDLAAARLAELIRNNGCGAVAVTWRHDPHCDHEAAAAIAQAACRITDARLLAYPIWGWTLPANKRLDEARIAGFRLDISSHLPRKRAAIMHHASQYAGTITDDETGFQLQSDFIARFLTPAEIYIEVDPGNAERG